jgi:hypothetical protein
MVHQRPVSNLPARPRPGQMDLGPGTCSLLTIPSGDGADMRSRQDVQALLASSGDRQGPNDTITISQRQTGARWRARETHGFMPNPRQVTDRSPRSILYCTCRVRPPRVEGMVGRDPVELRKRWVTALRCGSPLGPPSAPDGPLRSSPERASVW